MRKRGLLQDKTSGLERRAGRFVSMTDYTVEKFRELLPYFKEAHADLFGMERKQSNRMISSFRVRVDHAGGSMKRYRRVKDECRLRKNLFVGKVFINLCCTAQFQN